MSDKTYRERRMAKADRLDEWAGKREGKAEAGFERADEMGSVIPLGQPILVDHYSAGRDRRYRDRIGRTYDRAHEDAKKADEMRSKAESIRAAADRAIYSDDPDAVDRLEERIAGLEGERERIKAWNKRWRKADEAGRAVMLGEDSAEAREFTKLLDVVAWQCEKGFPSYALSNLSGRIKKDRDRLAVLQREEQQ